jgi:hypothetical protein
MTGDSKEIFYLISPNRTARYGRIYYSRSHTKAQRITDEQQRILSKGGNKTHQLRNISDVPTVQFPIFT